MTLAKAPNCSCIAFNYYLTLSHKLKCSGRNISLLFCFLNLIHSVIYFYIKHFSSFKMGLISLVSATLPFPPWLKGFCSFFPFMTFLMLFQNKEDCRLSSLKAWVVLVWTEKHMCCINLSSKKQIKAKIKSWTILKVNESCPQSTNTFGLIKWCHYL